MMQPYALGYGSSAAMLSDKEQKMKYSGMLFLKYK